MKWIRFRSASSVAHAILEHLTAIRLHAGVIRRRLRRDDPVARAEALDSLDAIEEHADAAAALVERETGDRLPRVDRAH